MNLSR